MSSSVPWVNEGCSVDFLHADTVINDIKTILMGDQKQVESKPVESEGLYEAGDNKQNYQDMDYQTRSVILQVAKTSVEVNALSIYQQATSISQDETLLSNGPTIKG